MRPRRGRKSCYSLDKQERFLRCQMFSSAFGRLALSPTTLCHARRLVKKAAEFERGSSRLLQNSADLEWQECSRFRSRIRGIKPRQLAVQADANTHTRMLHLQAYSNTSAEPRSAHAAQGPAARDRVPLERWPALSPHLHKSRLSAAAL